jgi:16S rRNA (guanine1207-N2)-methyltransferase
MKIEINIDLKSDWLAPVTYTAAGRSFSIQTYPGVFSYKKIDKATDFLLRSISFNPADKVLDLGCGVGIIGIVAAQRCPQGSVELVDIDPRAVALAQRNVATNNLKNAKVYASHVYDSVSSRDFDKIIVNLPAQIAKPVQQQILRGSREYLKPDGVFLVVLQARLQRFVKRELREVFKEVNFLGKESHFVIIEARNKK